MMWLVWPILFYNGFRAERIRSKPFILMFMSVVALTVVHNYITIDSARSLGENQSYRWHPLVFLGDVLVTFALWAGCYFLAYGLGAKRRRKRRITNPFT
jgi:hypothetical protein